MFISHLRSKAGILYSPKVLNLSKSVVSYDLRYTPETTVLYNVLNSTSTYTGVATYKNQIAHIPRPEIDSLYMLETNLPRLEPQTHRQSENFYQTENKGCLPQYTSNYVTQPEHKENV